MNYGRNLKRDGTFEDARQSAVYPSSHGDSYTSSSYQGYAPTSHVSRTKAQESDIHRYPPSPSHYSATTTPISMQPKQFDNRYNDLSSPRLISQASYSPSSSASYPASSTSYPALSSSYSSYSTSYSSNHTPDYPALYQGRVSLAQSSSSANAWALDPEQGNIYRDYPNRGKSINQEGKWHEYSRTGKDPSGPQHADSSFEPGDTFWLSDYSGPYTSKGMSWVNGAWRHRYRKDEDDPREPYRGRIGEVSERDMRLPLYRINDWVIIQGNPGSYRVVSVERHPHGGFGYRLEQLTGTSGLYPERMLLRDRRA